MAMQAESPAVTPSVQVVGNAFVGFFTSSPELVYRFYQDSSVLSRPDSDGVMSSTMTMQVCFLQTLPFVFLKRIQ